MDRPTLQYVFRILSYAPFQEVRDMYGKIHLRGDDEVYTSSHEL